MAAKYPAINGSPTADSDWSSLIERAVDDLSRIVHSEAQILQTRLGAALDLRFSSAISMLAAVGVMIAGALCLLAAAIILMHQWVPWWQSFGIAGAALMLVGIVCYATMGPRSEVHT